jgi:hypothetical protein
MTIKAVLQQLCHGVVLRMCGDSRTDVTWSRHIATNVTRHPRGTSRIRDGDNGCFVITIGDGA